MTLVKKGEGTLESHPVGYLGLSISLADRDEILQGRPVNLRQETLERVRGEGHSSRLLSDCPYCTKRRRISKCGTQLMMCSLSKILAWGS